MLRKPPEQRSQIFRPALAEKAQQGVELVVRQRRCVGKARIIAVLAGQECKGDGALARQRRQPFDTVAPPIQTSQQADHHDLGVLSHALEPKIDRERMPQVPQIGKPHRGKDVALLRPCNGKAGEVAVGERKDDDITGRLAQIDRLDQIVDGGRTGRQQVHCSTEQGAGDAVAIEPLQADDNELALARLRQRSRHDRNGG